MTRAEKTTLGTLLIIAAVCGVLLAYAHHQWAQGEAADSACEAAGWRVR